MGCCRNGDIQESVCIIQLQLRVAVKAPLKHIPMTAVGGVSPDNCADFIKAGCVGVGVGGNLVSPKLVAEGKFDEITKTAEAYVAALKTV